MSKLLRFAIQIPIEWKEQLDGLRQEGYTTSGFIRAMVERELGHADSRRQPAMPNSSGPMRKR